MMSPTAAIADILRRVSPFIRTERATAADRGLGGARSIKTPSATLARAVCVGLVSMGLAATPALADSAAKAALQHQKPAAPDLNPDGTTPDRVVESRAAIERGVRLGLRTAEFRAGRLSARRTRNRRRDDRQRAQLRTSANEPHHNPLPARARLQGHGHAHRSRFPDERRHQPDLHDPCKIEPEAGRLAARVISARPCISRSRPARRPSA